MLLTYAESFFNLGPLGWLDPETHAVSFETMEARRPDDGYHDKVLRPLHQHGTCLQEERVRLVGEESSINLRYKTGFEIQ